MSEVNNKKGLSTSHDHGDLDLQNTRAIKGTKAMQIRSVSPLFPVAMGLIGGILLDHYCALPLWLYLFFLISTTILCCSKSVRRFSAFFLVTLASVGVGGVLYLQTTRADDLTSIEKFASTYGVIVTLSGTIVSQPALQSPTESPFARWSFRKNRSGFLLEVDAIEEGVRSFEATGLLRVTVYEPVLDLELHDRISLSGRLYGLRPPGNPGEFDWSDYFRRMGIVARLVCPHRENIQILSFNHKLDTTMESSFIERSLFKIRRHVRGLLSYDVLVGGDEPSSLPDAMILGQRSKLQRRINDVFFRAGCMHLLAVSGLHLAIPMSFVWILGRLFSIPKRKCALLLMLTVLVYLMIAESRPSILRASVMGMLLAISILLGRSRSSLNFLSAAAIVLLLYSPVMLFDLGFQLSFLSVLGIIYLSVSFRQMWIVFSHWVSRVVLKKTLMDQIEEIDNRGVYDREINDIVNTMGVGWSYRWYRIRRLMVRFFVFPVMVGLGAWLATLPIVLYLFHFLHIFSPINSVLVSPFVYFFVLTGLAKIVIGLLFPGAESWLDGPLQWLDTHMIRLVDFLGTLPGSSISVSPPPGWWIAAYYVLLILFVCRFRRPIYKKTIQKVVKVSSSSISSRLKWLNRSSAAALFVFVISTAVWCMPGRIVDRLTVTVLSVGAGSATVIELPDGRVMIYDAGSLHWLAIGRSTVIPFLRNRGIRKIDRAYLSHANLDHYNGLIDVVDAFPTGSIVVNEYFLRKNDNKAPVRFLLDQLRDRGIHVETIEPVRGQWNEGDVIFEHLWPVGEFDESLSNNDASGVMRLTYKNHSILFTGDIEDRAQLALLEREPTGGFEDGLVRSGLHADVLLLPHHGSIRSSTGSFLEAVGASIVIRSSHDRTRAPFMRSMVENPDLIGSGRRKQIVGSAVRTSTPLLIKEGAGGGFISDIERLVSPADYYNTADVGAVTITIDSKGVHIETVRSTTGSN